MELSHQLEKLLDDEQSYWKQRSKITWLTERDRNTKYFHRQTSNKRAKNRLESLYDVDGVWREAGEGMDEVLLEYFSNMFKFVERDEGDMHRVLALLAPTVIPEMNSQLCSVYSKEGWLCSKCTLLNPQGQLVSGIISKVLEDHW